MAKLSRREMMLTVGAMLPAACGQRLLQLDAFQWRGADRFCATARM